MSSIQCRVSDAEYQVTSVRQIGDQEAALWTFEESKRISNKILTRRLTVASIAEIEIQRSRAFIILMDLWMIDGGGVPVDRKGR